MPDQPNFAARERQQLRDLPGRSVSVTAVHNFYACAFKTVNQCARAFKGVDNNRPATLGKLLSQYCELTFSSAECQCTDHKQNMFFACHSRMFSFKKYLGQLEFSQIL